MCCLTRFAECFKECIKKSFKYERIEVELRKILPSGGNDNTANNTILRVPNILSPKELDEYVLMYSKMYKKIFHKEKKDSNKGRIRLSIVKIQCGKNTIHRAFMYSPINGLDDDIAALTPNSISLLTSKSGKQMPKEVIVSKGCWWNYYWYHPNAAVRMSFRVGVIGIAITITLTFKNECLYLIKQILEWIQSIITILINFVNYLLIIIKQS